MSLFAELKRRNVIRMAGLYLVGAWLIVQVAGTVLPMFGAPEWLPRSIVVLLAIGFLPALVFSWVYELTPQGLKREEEVAGERSITPHTGQRMDRLIILGLAVIVVLLAVDRFWPRTAQRDAGSVASSADTHTRRIAVLPFLNLSGDPSQEFFSDGITEEILNVLAGIEDFTVTSRTSSFHFKGRDEPLPDIARELHVDYVLEGSVRKAGQQVRITAQLIKVDGDAHLWSESWTRDLADIFAVQEDIARKVANELEARLSDRDEARLTRTGTHNAAAYEEYLHGRQLWNERSLASLLAAVDAFKTALAADPSYADAWSGLAQTYAVMPEYIAFTPGAHVDFDTVALAHEAADRALALEPTSSRALSARAYVRIMSEFDWAGAESDYRAAIAADPRDAVTRQWYAELLAYQRRREESNAQYEVAFALDPLAPIIHQSRGVLALLAGDEAMALEDFDEALRLVPGFSYAPYLKVEVLMGLRRFDAALTAAGDLSDGDRGLMTSVIAALEDPSRTDEAVRQIEAQGRDTIPGRPFLFAVVGRFDLALPELERLFEANDPYRVFLGCMVAFDPLHDDPRFQALLRRIAWPAQAAQRPAQASSSSTP